MKGLLYQIKSIIKDKFCLTTFILPIIVAIALNLFGTIDLSSQGEFHFGTLKNDLSPQTLTWLAQYGSVEIFVTPDELHTAIIEPSTVVIGVKANGTSIKTIIAGDELRIFQQTAATLPALYAQREDAKQMKISLWEQADIMKGFQNIFVAAVLVIAMFMGCTFNAMNIISEKEDGITLINAILPMTPSQYIIQKIAVGFLCGCLSSMVTACICFHLSWQNTGSMLILLILSAFIAALIGLFIGDLAAEAMIGIVYIKIVMLIFIAVPILCALLEISGPFAILCYLVPSHPAFEGIIALSLGNGLTAGKDIIILAIHCIAWFLLYIVISAIRKKHA